jgi:predicted nucleic acid-binding protein
MADAAIYSIALEHNATLWTQDVDYQNLPQVQYFPKG